MISSGRPLFCDGDKGDTCGQVELLTLSTIVVSHISSTVCFIDCHTSKGGGKDPL